jgi:TonB family protein
MRDRVAEVLAQRETLERGPGAGIAISLVLHGALTAAGVYAALHAPAPQPATMVSIQFASPPAPLQQPAKTAPKPVAPAPAKIEEPKPRIEEPKPEPVKPEPPKPADKNTVPLSPFGRSTKKGSETPVVPPAPPNTGAPPTGTAPEIPIGGSGVAGLEGGDFPYTLYVQAMHRRVGGQWVRSPGYSGPAAVIYFRILRDGTITEAKVSTSSGNPTFDRAALSAVRSASPLNPLPFGYNGTYLGVYLAFR